MLGALVLALLSLRPLCHRPCAAAFLQEPGNAPWFMGCVDASGGRDATGGTRDLDPVTCEHGSVALYRTEGPFLHSVRLSTAPERVQAGKTFVMEVSGNLAGRILGLGEQDFSYVTVEFQEMTPKGQSSHNVNVLDDGSFLYGLHLYSLVKNKCYKKYNLYLYVLQYLFCLLTVRIYAAKQAYPTNTDITFLAMAGVADAVEFLWHFGDSRSERTTSRTVTKRYHKPGRYAVVVVMSRGRTSLTSDVFPLVVQRSVKLNRLVHQASVLQNQTVAVSCRLNVGTDVTFLWSFGDGSSRLGQSTEQHVFHRTGEFRVEVTVSNLVSSASLSGHIFVVDRSCQPPQVKNMGPRKLQVRRYEVIHLGVTYETEVDCDISGGLHYTWALFDSAGRAFPLPLVDTRRQSLMLPSHLLHYDTYTAIARVQVAGSVVYSNYSVRVQVIPSPPVAFIQGGTNIFINNRNNTVVTLDGQRSYDPDFPLNPVSFSWTCKPVSTITSSCFLHDVPTSSPVLVFPASFLKHNFDQFQFSFNIHSGERSASSEIFLTLTPNVIGKVSVYCPQCQGEQVNWHQSFSVSALCEGCDISPEHIQYTWSLYLVNASSKPVIEVPFCYTVDLSAPSTIMEGPATQTPGTSTQPPPAAGASQFPHTVDTSAPVILSQNASETSMPLYSSTEYLPLAFDNSGVLYSDHFLQGDVISEFPIDSDSSADWEFYFPLLESGDLGGQQDYDVPLMSAEEGDPGVSAGRPTGESFSPGDDSFHDPALPDDEGNNLMDSRPSVVIQEPVLLDLPRDLVNRGLFESYTDTGTLFRTLTDTDFISLSPPSQFLNTIFSLFPSFQLFIKTNSAPKGVTCQVQPVKGRELYTHFSIFCSSGKEDLLYEYSVSVGDGPPRTLYKGKDFQYYFSLPSGDPNDDHKVTIYTEIKSSMYGAASKPCPVTVRVQPSFFRDASSSHLNPDLELSESGLRNLSALVRLGNSVEIRNYVSLLSSILNRLSLDAKADTRAQERTRNVLICTVCELERSGQVSMVDNICILKNLLEVTSQVTLASARRVAVHVQIISELFSSAPVWYSQKTLNTLVALLSRSLQAALTSHDFTPEMSTSGDITQTLESDPHDEIQDSLSGISMDQGLPISTKQALQLVADILQTASDLMLVREDKHGLHRVGSGLIALYVAYLNQTSTVLRSGSTIFYMPDSLIQLLVVHRSRDPESRPHRLCVLSVLTELTHSPYTWAYYPETLSGPVVDLSLYKCSSKRKIPVRSLIQPINIQLQQPPRNSSEPGYVLLCSQINYHTFNITQEHLRQAIQLSVVFTQPLNKVFPIMLLFRMFERPTPSMHHLHKIHHWESNATRFTLPPSYLSAAGVGHLALLNADFGETPRHKYLSEQVRYSLTVDSSLCLSWDGHQGAWTHLGCSTQQADAATAVNCSCHQLRPLTVVRQQIHSSHDTTDLDPSLSVSSDLTVLGVLVLCVCLYIPGLVVCKRADVVSEANQRIHYLSDNSPGDPYLYAVTIHTGLCSAACMSAKVYIVLNGEDGFSQTSELQVPGCVLIFFFHLKSIHDTEHFYYNTLGPVWGVHIWHDNSGPSTNWYLKQVEVFEVSRGHVKARAWLFVGQCWLAVNKADGRVERMLRVCTHGIGFAKILRLKLSDYMADYHIWMSLYSCPCPNAFTHTQRLSVSLLLLLGYACVNTVIISQMNNRLPFELGIIDLSAISLTTGVLSVAAASPAAVIVSLLFRLREVKRMGSVVQHTEGRRRDKDPFGGLYLNEGPDLLSVSTTILENKSTGNTPEIQSDVDTRKEDSLEVKNYIRPTLQNVLLITERNNVDQAPREKEILDLLSESSRFPGTQRALLKMYEWSSVKPVVWIILNLCIFNIYFLYVCIFRIITVCLRFKKITVFSCVRFSSSKVLLWIHSLFFSLMFCIFLIQPAVILSVAVSVSFWHRKRSDFHSFFSIREIEKDTPTLWSHSGAQQPAEQLGTSAFPQERCSYLEKLLGARQRARYLRLVRPPTPAELRKTCGKKRRETLIHSTLRDLSLCGSMLLLMLCMSYGASFTDHYHLNKAVRTQFISGHGDAFMSIQTHEHWWKWAQSSLLTLLYKNASSTTESHILIGEPVLRKMEVSNSFQGQVSVPPKTCCHLGCYLGPSTTVGLGHTKSNAASKLKLLHSGGWLCRQTVSVQFTLFSPAPNLFTSVTMLSEQSPTGVLLPSAKVHSVTLYHTPAVWDYVVMVCQLLFLILSLLQLCNQVYAIGQQGLMGYWRTPFNCLEVSLLTVSLLYYVYYIYHSTIIFEVVELLQRHNYTGHVDVSLQASSEQYVRTLRGITLLLLTMKCGTMLRVNRTLASSAALLTRSLSSLFWPTVISLSLAFCSLPRSLQTLLCHCWGFRAVWGLHLSDHDFLYRGVLYLSSVMGVVSSLVRRAKRSQSWGNVFSVAELVDYIRRRVSELTGQRRRTYFFEEFESLVDELLFRLNALSSSLHPPPPPKAHHYREEDSTLKVEMLQRGQRGVHSSSVVVWDASQQPDTIAKESLKGRELQTYLKAPNHLFLPESTSRTRTENTQEKPVNEWTQTNDNCCLTKTQSTHTEVVVEVLVHQESGSVMPDKQ
uniref:Polycystic kidney disease 1b n=1 Tax=Cyclopterus lumpus TaxID=8103 RepID=A0A8C2ZWB2_CYCLU